MTGTTTPRRAAASAAATPPGRRRPDPEHRDDGLDLARALTRATAEAGARPRRQAAAAQAPPAAGGRVSGAHPDDRDPQLLDTTLDRLVDDHGWELDLRVHGVFGRWPELVGERGRRSTAPRSRSPTASWWCAPTRPPGPPSCGCSPRRSYAASTRSSATARSTADRRARARTCRPGRRAALGPRRPRSARHLRLSRPCDRSGR